MNSNNIPVARQQHTTTGYQANSPKVNIRIECFGEFDPNAVRYASTVVRWSGLSFGSPARAPSSPVSCRPAKAVLRHGFSRSRSTGRQKSSSLLSLRADRRTSGNLTVVCNLGGQDENLSTPKTKPAIRAG